MIKNQFHYALNLSYDTKLTDTVSNIRNITYSHGTRIYEHSTSTTITPDPVHTRRIILRLRYASKHTEESSNHRKVLSLPPFGTMELKQVPWMAEFQVGNERCQGCNN